MLTNKNQQGAYRGFGSEVNNWMLERIVDKAARELDLDRVEIRRRNFIPAGVSSRTSSRPATSTTPATTRPCSTKALELVDYDHWVAERERARAEGRHIGIGLITSQERSVFSSTEFWFWFDEPAVTPTSSPESVTVRVDATGEITATLYSLRFWGNSPETMVAQLVAEEFDVDPASSWSTTPTRRTRCPGPGRAARATP